MRKGTFTIHHRQCFMNEGSRKVFCGGAVESQLSAMGGADAPAFERAHRRMRTPRWWSQFSMVVIRSGAGRSSWFAPGNTRAVTFVLPPL